MGGSPSERKMSNTKDDRAQRYIQNKKGRTSFFLYSRPPTISPITTSVQRVPASTGTNQQQIAVPMKMKPNTTKNPSLSQSQPPMLLEMEVVSSSSDSEESDDNFSSTPDNAILSSKAAIRRRRRRSNADLVTAATATFGPVTMVEPHIATRVQFANVEIRSYAITIGDHPCCTIGCPITLDWDYTKEDTVSLHDYETHKYATNNNNNHQSMTPTKMNDLRISPEERVELLLLSSKLSELEIRRASRKFHRSKNCSIRQCERIHETFFHCRDFHTDDDDEMDMDDDVQEQNVAAIGNNTNNNDDDDSMSSNNTDDDK
jgi:hypothetical protein